MVKEGTGVAYKSFRTFSNKISTSDLQQNDEFQISTYPSKQPNCFELPLKDGRAKSQKLLRLSKEIWLYLLKHQIMITVEYLFFLSGSTSQVS